MARGAEKLARSEAIPTLEHFRAITHNNIIIGATALELTRSDGAKGMSIQNGHASQVLYIGGGIPQLIHGFRKDMKVDFQRGGQWLLSANGTNEWYYASSTGGDSELTETTYLYYKALAGSETLGTSGTVSSLNAQHKWGWGDGDTLGWDTIYMRTDGSEPTDSPAGDYEYLLSYTFTLTADDTAVTGGFEIAAGASFDVTLDGAGKVFAIASGATTPAKILEVF